MAAKRMPPGTVIELVAEHLMMEGPATISDVAGKLNIDAGSVRTVLYRFKGTRFEKAGLQRPGVHGGRPEEVWTVHGYALYDRERAVKDAATARRLQGVMKRLQDGNNSDDGDEYFAAYQGLSNLSLLLAAHVELMVAAMDKMEADRVRSATASGASATGDCRM